MVQDHDDWRLHPDDNAAWRNRQGAHGRDDPYGQRDRFSGRYDEGRSWRGRDRYGADYGERAYADRVYGRDQGYGYGEGGHSLESFGRSRIAGGDYGRRGYGQTGVGQNANDQGGVAQSGFSQAGYNQDDYSPSRNLYGEGGAGRADGGAGYRWDGYGGRPVGRAENPYLSDIAGGEHRGRGPKNYVRSDSRIAEDVNDRLSDAADVDARDIEVKVKDGEVTLSGVVDRRHAKRRAEDMAEAVSGVRHVQNNLRVASPDTMNSISADNAKF
jgi:hypothetical protein